MHKKLPENVKLTQGQQRRNQRSPFSLEINKKERSNA
jgi:hypothetical protein